MDMREKGWGGEGDDAVAAALSRKSGNPLAYYFFHRFYCYFPRAPFCFFANFFLLLLHVARRV